MKFKRMGEITLMNNVNCCFGMVSTRGARVLDDNRIRKQQISVGMSMILHNQIKVFDIQKSITVEI